MWFALIVFGSVLQFAALRSNPPGFFLDESSIGLNAYTIATSGSDEHGVAWPLFFKAFGEYKNPVYIYIVAGVFRVFGPGVVSIRVTGVVAGLITALLLGLLAARISKNTYVGLLTASLTLLTPWLFELSRLAFEVTIYPLMLVLFLWAVQRASAKERWSLIEVLTIAFSLALLTYTYSVGRLLAPMLALGLLLFASRKRAAGILLTWVVFALTLVPILIFQWGNPTALTRRFEVISYVHPESTWLSIFKTFAANFSSNLNPWRLFVTESSRVSEIVHVPGPPAMLSVTLFLVIGSLVLLVRPRKFDAWWRFIAFGLLASVVPASLTIDKFHMLRLTLVPIFLLTLCIPALEWLISHNQRVLFALVVIATLSQGGWFLYRYHNSVNSERRRHVFDAEYRKTIFAPALEQSTGRSIYLADSTDVPGYVQAYWYGILSGVSLDRFVHLGFEDLPPANAVVISTEVTCFHCRVVAQTEPYTLYVTTGEQLGIQPLAKSSMRAELTIGDIPSVLKPGQGVLINVSVKNLGDVVWSAGSRTVSPNRICTGNHWFYEGVIIQNDDGRGCLKTDVRPGETVSLPFTVNAPRRLGDYVLEIDVVQEGVSWFGNGTAKQFQIKVSD